MLIRSFAAVQETNQMKRKFVNYLSVSRSNVFVWKMIDFGLLLANYYIPIYSRKITMEKTVSKPVEETSFKPLLHTIQQSLANLPIECDNETILIAFAGPTTYDLVRNNVSLYSNSSFVLLNRPTSSIILYPVPRAVKPVALRISYPLRRAQYILFAVMQKKVGNGLHAVMLWKRIAFHGVNIGHFLIRMSICLPLMAFAYWNIIFNSAFYIHKY